jgi:glutamate racemase
VLDNTDGVTYYFLIYQETLCFQAYMTDDRQRAIGIFDSGIGGLTVLRAVKRLLPAEKILYLGDTARVPYGIRSEQTVIKYCVSNTDFLLQQNIKLLVIACNTASAVAIEPLREKYDLPIIDVVGPGARCAARTTRSSRVGIIGTAGTIASNAYQRELLRLNPSIVTVARACPLFVPLAEEGWYDEDDTVVLDIAHRYLDAFAGDAVDTMVLGCTHYPLLKKVIQRVVGRGVTLIDSAEETAADVRRMLQSSNLAAPPGRTLPGEIYLTDIPRRFVEIGNTFLGEDMGTVKLVDI